ncbi:chemotaxis protein CheX [Crateriforma spongiae]|uniref:chemotaxis protein CheX n=1 Tax=Crateriforma spongiae TaxID=2724528 RepID=UPI0039AFA819
MSVAIDVQRSATISEAADESLRDVIETMTGGTVRQVSSDVPHVEEAATTVDRSPLTITVSLSGELNGCIGLCLSRNAALQWTEAISGESTEEIDQLVIDACGELGNMVVGGVKRRLDDVELKMGLPTAFRAGRDGVVFCSSMQPIFLAYEYGDTTLDVFVALAATPS